MNTIFKKWIQVLIWVLPGLLYPLATGSEIHFVLLRCPPFTQIRAEGLKVEENLQNGFYRLTLPQEIKFPVKITEAGAMGGQVVQKASSLSQLQELQCRQGIIANPDPDPPTLKILPVLCPRVKIIEAKRIQAPKGLADSKLLSLPSLRFLYDASKDRVNHLPSYQLFDPDANEGKQPLALSKMDGKNVLKVKRIKVSYDYEDSHIVDYRGKDPKSGKERLLMEGKGGFYSNIHYAIVPYSEKLAHLDRQTLLHLVHGTLGEVGKMKLRPELRTSSFLPGPFLSRSDFFYDLCEWGDTSHQAPQQSLEYENLAVWDWDYPVKNRNHVLMVVWEEDEEQKYPDRNYLEPHYLIDDLIGVFDIRKGNTRKPLTLKNTRGDFEITVQSGDLQVFHPSPLTLGFF